MVTHKNKYPIPVGLINVQNQFPLNNATISADLQKEVYTHGRHEIVMIQKYMQHIISPCSVASAMQYITFILILFVGLFLQVIQYNP